MLYTMIQGIHTWDVIATTCVCLAGLEEANLRWSGQEQGYTCITAREKNVVGYGVGKHTQGSGGSGGMLPQENFEIYNL